MQSNSSQSSSIQVNPIQFKSNQFNSNQSNPIQFKSFQSNSNQSNSIQIKSIQFEWILSNLNQSNPIQFKPIQSNSSQSNPVQINPIQFKSIQSIQFKSIQSSHREMWRLVIVCHQHWFCYSAFCYLQVLERQQTIILLPWMHVDCVSSNKDKFKRRQMLIACRGFYCHCACWFPLVFPAYFCLIKQQILNCSIVIREYFCSWNYSSRTYFLILGKFC